MATDAGKGDQRENSGYRQGDLGEERGVVDARERLVRESIDEPRLIQM